MIFPLDLVCDTVKDLKAGSDILLSSIRTAVGNTQYGHDEFFAKLVIDACCKFESHTVEFFKYYFDSVSIAC